MTSYAEQASKAHRAYRAAIINAQSHRDPELSADALQKKRLEMKRAAEDAYASERNKIEAEAKAHHATASGAAGEARPKVANHAQIDSNWKMVERLLDSGRTVREIIAKASGATLLAIREHAPSYLESKTTRPGLGEEQAKLPNVARLVDDRLIALNDDAAQYIAKERDAQLDLDRALVYTQSSSADSDLDLAIKAQYTGQAPADDED